MSVTIIRPGPALLPLIARQLLAPDADAAKRTFAEVDDDEETVALN